MLVLGVAAWHLRKKSDVALFGVVLRVGLWASLVAAIATLLLGHAQGQLMTKQQPMKMAAAEALYETKTGAPFSLFDLGPWQARPSKSLVSIAIPHGLSILADNSWNGKVLGINDIEAAYVAKYGPGDYRPIVGIDYWSFRIMTGLGTLALLIAAIGLWLARVPGRIERSKRYLRIAVWAIALPLAANLAGWLFTEMGRQPWVVQGLLLTKNAVSPTVGPWSVGLTLVGFTALYGVLAFVEGLLMIRAAQAGPEPEGTYPDSADGTPTTVPALTY
jgi:cytochrome d ubiquinol oxidase subunit I